jgi:hypothetical protein
MNAKTGMFVYFIFLNANWFKKSATTISKTTAVSLYSFEFVTGFLTMICTKNVVLKRVEKIVSRNSPLGLERT